MPRGGPVGNQKALKHGVYALMAIRKTGTPQGKNPFVTAFRNIEEDYIRALGGDPSLRRQKRKRDRDAHCGLSPQMMEIIQDLVWVHFYRVTIDHELAGKTRLVRKGKPHALIDLRIRLAAHNRENIKLLGLKRVAKDLSLEQYIQEKYGNRDNGQDDKSEATNAAPSDPTQEEKA